MSEAMVNNRHVRRQRHSQSTFQDAEILDEFSDDIRYKNGAMSGHNCKTFQQCRLYVGHIFDLLYELLDCVRPFLALVQDENKLFKCINIMDALISKQKLLGSCFLFEIAQMGWACIQLNLSKSRSTCTRSHQSRHSL